MATIFALSLHLAKLYPYVHLVVISLQDVQLLILVNLGDLVEQNILETEREGRSWGVMKVAGRGWAVIKN
jgi:hypothetical protein